MLKAWETDIADKKDDADSVGSMERGRRGGESGRYQRIAKGSGEHRLGEWTGFSSLNLKGELERWYR